MLKLQGFALHRLSSPQATKAYQTFLFHPLAFFYGVAESSVESISIWNAESACAPSDQERQAIIDKLRSLLLSGRTGDAYKLNESLVFNRDSPFSSPTHLYSLFTVSCPSMSSTILDMLLCIASTNDMVDEGTKLYGLARKDGRFPSIYSLREYFKLLKNSKIFDKTLELFDEMIKSGFRPDKFIHGKAVEAATRLGNLDRAKEIVNLMKMEGGVGSTVFVHNILISHLCKKGKLRDALDVFDEMLELRLRPTTVTYNALIDGCCNAGEIDEAIRLRHKMIENRVQPCMITFNTLLSGLCKSGRMDETNTILEEMGLLGFLPDGFTCSIIFDGFSRSRDANGALSFYDKLTQKGVKINHYTGSILLNGLCKSGNVKKAEEVLERLVESGYDMDVPVYNPVVCGYCRAGDFNGAMTVIERMECRGLRPDSISFNSMITWFCEQGKMDEANSLVHTMLEKGINATVQTYNILINGYGKLCLFDKCFRILDEMEANGVLPNVISYGSLINSLCKDGKVVEAEILLRDMFARQVQPNARIYNMLIDGNCAVGKIQDAFRFFDEMLRFGIEPSLVTCNLLISGLCQSGRVKEAEDMFLEISKTGHKPDVVSYNTLISGYAKIEDAQKCLELYDTLLSNGLKPTVHTYQALISGCTKEGIVLVEKLYIDLLALNLSPDRIIYNDLIICYAENGDVQRSLSFVQQMFKRNIPLDKMTYKSLILGCFKSGVEVEERTIRCIVDIMNNEGLSEGDTYNIVIKGYCLAKDFEKAYNWYKEMVEKKRIPNSTISKDLIDGLHHSGMVGEAITVSSQMNINDERGSFEDNLL